MFDQLKDVVSKEQLYEIATQHMRRQPDLPVLSLALRHSIAKDKASVQTLDQVIQSYFTKPRQLRYVSICVVLTELVRALPERRSD